MFHARIGVIWTYFLCPATTLPLRASFDTIIPGGMMRSLGVHGKRGILREVLLHAIIALLQNFYRAYCLNSDYIRYWDYFNPLQ